MKVLVWPDFGEVIDGALDIFGLLWGYDLNKAVTKGRLLGGESS